MDSAALACSRGFRLQTTFAITTTECGFSGAAVRPHGWRESLVERLDKLICETIPGLRTPIKWKKAYYGVSELGWIIEMVACDVSVNVVFSAGQDSTLRRRSVAVGGLHHRVLHPDALEPDHAVHPTALDLPLALQLESEFVGGRPEPQPI